MCQLSWLAFRLQPTIDLKVTSLRSAADYSGKPLYPKPEELGSTGFLHSAVGSTS
jgi:hypothetical protein